MAQRKQRPQPEGKNLKFNKPNSEGAKPLQEELPANADFDPAALWDGGTMEAMALTGVLEKCEERLGQEGKELVYDALHETFYEKGLSVGSQILKRIQISKEATSRYTLRCW